ncbi:hypothetical protein ACFVSN_19250 [Kitasatospora sp. NPDC057904]|uniref:hypothetical protein n=1 Tax=unclassified Kitasatospora TaxID=2633591 RepID=UPI0036DA8884
MKAELPFAVSVEIKGVTKAATFSRLPDALEAVRTAVSHLPLDEDQADFLADLFSPRSADRIARQLLGVGAMRVIAFVGIAPHPIYLCPAPD